MTFLPTNSFTSIQCFFNATLWPESGWSGNVTIYSNGYKSEISFSKIHFTSSEGQWTVSSDLRHSSGRASQSHWLDTAYKLPSLQKLLLNSFRYCVWTHCPFIAAKGVVTFTFALRNFMGEIQSILIGIHMIRNFHLMAKDFRMQILRLIQVGHTDLTK